MEENPHRTDAFVHTFIVGNRKLCAHIQNFSLKFPQEVGFVQYTKIRENILESTRNVSETPQVTYLSMI